MRRDLETQGNSTLWNQLTHPGRKAVLLQAVYRQFQRMGVPGSDTVKSQEQRWENIISKWELAIKDQKEMISMGDFNINTIRWETPFMKKKHPMKNSKMTWSKNLTPESLKGYFKSSTANQPESRMQLNPSHHV